MNAPVPTPVKPDAWARAGRAALAKMISELSYEEVLAPDCAGGGAELRLASGVVYRFACTRGIWGNLLIDPKTLSRTPAAGVPTPLQFVPDARAELGMTPATEANFLRELSNTLRQDIETAAKYGALDADALISLPVHALHAALEGHPKAVANKGRIGWGTEDLARFSPEMGGAFRLFWLAADRRHCKIGASGGGDERALIESSLGAEEASRLFAARLAAGASADTHALIPVHPWQWDHVLQQAYVGELAERRLIPLGHFGGRYTATPSLRTLTSIDRPGSPDVKLALTILNTSAWRGIPGKYIAVGGALSDWLEGITQADPLLSSRVTVLRELRGIWYEHPVYAQVPDLPYQFAETLGVIWRDSASGRVAGGRRACLMATLLHRAPDGTPLAAAHARRAGMGMEDWLRALFRVTVVPLYHYLTRYGVGFIAHGQNVTVVLEDDVPVGMAVKDLQGDLDLIDQDFPELAGLDPEIQATLPRKPATHIIHDIQTAHFVTVLRFLSARLSTCGAMDEKAFYRILGEELQAHMNALPELAERFAMFDLFTPTLPRVCINKVRLAIGYGDDAARPLPALGTDLVNPLYICKAR